MTTILRSLDAGEAFFAMVDPVASMNFIVIAELDGAIEPLALRAALDRASRSQPLLRAAIAVEADHLVFVAAEAPIPVTRAPIGPAGWAAPVAAALGRRFERHEAPLLRCLHLDTVDGNSVLALVFQHSIADGRSGVGLMVRILADLAGAAEPTAVADFPPPMQSLFPAKRRAAEDPEAVAEAARLKKAHFTRNGRSTPLPWERPAEAAPAPRIVPMAVDAPTSDKLLRAARAAGATLHGAIGAAQLHSVAAAIPSGSDSVLILSSPVDLRAYLDRAPAADELGLYISFLSSSYRMDAPEGFWGLARQISADLKAQLARGEAHLFHDRLGLDRIAPDAAGIAGFNAGLARMPHDVMLSNIGRVDAVPGLERVRAISFALHPLRYQSMFLAASSFRGRVLLNLVHDAMKLPPAVADGIARDIVARLTEAAR